MNVLVVGKGGREHALTKALMASPNVATLHTLPGSSGMASMALCHSGATDSATILALVQRHEIHLVVIGPENELVAGVADDLRKAGVSVFGPDKAGAKLEGSKIFSKEFMREFNVPTAAYDVVSSVSDVEKIAEKYSAPYVLKADGLAAGKGVYIANSYEDLITAARELFEEKKFGSSGRSALLEEHQKGWELSFHVITNGKEYQPLPLTQDHKRLLEEDRGPNTGGMGVVGPLKIDQELEDQIHREILKPTIDGLAKKGWDYRGVLYVGIMVTEEGPKVIEYNVRFGDPEAQVTLPLLDGDWGEVMKAVAEGLMVKLKWKPIYSACVVLAAEGYPDSPVKGVEIRGDIEAESSSSYFLHAGTQRDSSSRVWQTGGGRVLNSVALGSSLTEAVENSYAQAEKVNWKNMQMRRDIGQKAF
ncbi:phosphoribosylamine--glycine ligase [Bdellovibrionales bacterium]|nr:phosphoribosylamine--glycine ligase [Bdellovibrionales bacterium]